MDLPPGPWWMNRGPTAPPPLEGFEISGALEVPPARLEPMATGKHDRDSPGSNSYLTPPPGLGDSMSSCAGSPAMPDTPTVVPLPKAVARVEPPR